MELEPEPEPEPELERFASPAPPAPSFAAAVFAAPRPPRRLPRSDASDANAEADAGDEGGAARTPPSRAPTTTERDLRPAVGVEAVLVAIRAAGPATAAMVVFSLQRLEAATVGRAGARGRIIVGADDDLAMIDVAISDACTRGYQAMEKSKTKKKGIQVLLCTAVAAYVPVTGAMAT